MIEEDPEVLEEELPAAQEDTPVEVCHMIILLHHGGNNCFLMLLLLLEVWMWNKVNKSILTRSRCAAMHLILG